MDSSSQPASAPPGAPASGPEPSAPRPDWSGDAAAAATHRGHRRQLAANLLPVVAAVLALAMVALLRTPTAPPVTGAPPWLAVVLVATVALGALHRPLAGAGLGLGAAALPLTILVLGPVEATLVAAAGFLLAELGRRLLWRLSPWTPPERRGWRRLGEGPGRVALATLAAALVVTALAGDRPALALGLAAVVHLAVGAGLAILDRRLRRPAEVEGVPAALATALPPLALDVGGWGFGLAVAAVLGAPPAAWGTAAALLAGWAILSLEAARAGFLHGAFERQTVELKRVGRAGWRMTETPALDESDLADQVRTECARVLPFTWFQMELGGEDDGPIRSYWAGPGGVIQEGLPDPGPSPPALPGIHRRPRWRRLERQLEVDGQPAAHLTFWCDPRLLEPGQLELLDALLPQLAGWVHRAALGREAREDELTGLPVRRVFERALAAAFGRRYEGGGSLAVVLADVDRFKRVNDTWGHAVGDRVLVAVAELLERERRASDLVARWGGEEMVILLDDTDGRRALAVAEHLRSCLEDLEVMEEGEAIPVTASFGVAAFPELYAPDPQALLVLADEALYRAKETGRNRCLLALGRDRFRGADGAEVTAGEAASGPGDDAERTDAERPGEVPRFFA